MHLDSWQGSLRTLSCLVHLTALTLSEPARKLRDLPPGLSALSKLRMLDLTESIQAQAVEGYSWVRHPHLSALSLSGCGLARLPQALLELRSLKVGWGGVERGG